jgi:DNA-binding SARP family transcriptional activator
MGGDTMPEDDTTQPASGATQLSLLGGFNLHAGGVRVTLPECSQRLVTFVALHDRPQPRPVVAGTLWPDKSEARACANLRSALWRARAAAACSPLVVDGPLLRLAPSVSVDTATFESVGWSIVAEPSKAVEVDRRLYFRELLPGCYDDWVIVERERLALLGLHFLEAIAEGLSAAGRQAEALDTALRLVMADPLRERSQLVLIRVLLDEGSHVRAVAQLAIYVRLIEATFGSKPSESFQRSAQLLIERGARPRSTQRHVMVRRQAGHRKYAATVDAHCTTRLLPA